MRIPVIRIVDVCCEKYIVLIAVAAQCTLNSVYKVKNERRVSDSLQNRRNFFAHFRRTEAKARRARSVSRARGEEREKITAKREKLN